MGLPSGLVEEVSNNEQISRFLTSSSHFNSTAIKPSAFLPNRNDGRLSVARHRGSPDDEVLKIALEGFGLPKCKGVGVLLAEEIRAVELDLEAMEPPLRHADIINWKWAKDDPAFGKSENKFKAAKLAQKATRIILPCPNG